jgi:GMP synthase-like glutamine amidotransferase
VQRLHKFHKRIVSEAPPRFKALAENQEIFVSESNQIMSFQGHPEMTAKIAQNILSTGDKSDLADPSPE